MGRYCTLLFTPFVVISRFWIQKPNCLNGLGFSMKSWAEGSHCLEHFFDIFKARMPWLLVGLNWHIHVGSWIKRRRSSAGLPNPSVFSRFFFFGRTQRFPRVGVCSEGALGRLQSHGFPSTFPAIHGVSDPESLRIGFSGIKSQWFPAGSLCRFLLPHWEHGPSVPLSASGVEKVWICWGLKLLPLYQRYSKGLDIEDHFIFAKANPASRIWNTTRRHGESALVVAHEVAGH